MGNLFGGGNEGGDSTMMILVLGVAMLCCSSSAVLGYGWYENWFCEMNTALGRECAEGPTDSAGAGGDSAGAGSDSAGDAAGSGSDSAGDAAGGTGDTGGGDGGGGDGGDGGGGGGGSKKVNKCKNGVKVELAYLPLSTMYGKEAQEPATLVKNKKETPKKLNKDFLKDCVSQYHCKIGDDVYASEKFGKLVYVGKKPLNSKGKELKKDYVGVYTGAIKGYKKIKINGKGPFPIGDSLGDGNTCEVSLYTGKNSKPTSYEGLKDKKNFSLNYRIDLS